NVVISVAGNVDIEFITKVEDYLNQFDDESKPNKIEKPIYIDEDIRKYKDTEQAHLGFGYDALPIYDERNSSVAVLNNVLGGSMSTRLFQDVRENKGLAYAVFSGHSSHLDSGMLTIYAGTGKDSLESLKSTIE